MTDDARPPIRLDRPGRPGVSRSGANRCGTAWPPTAPTLELDPEALLATATERTGLDDWGDPAFRERLDVLCTALRDEAGLSDTGPRDGLRAAGGQPGQPTSAGGARRRASRDRGHPDRAADHHLRAAAHRHHASAQPAGRRPGAALPAVLGEPRAVPGARTKTIGTPRRDRCAAGLDLVDMPRCRSSSACTR